MAFKSRPSIHHVLTQTSESSYSFKALLGVLTREAGRLVSGSGRKAQAQGSEWRSRNLIVGAWLSKIKHMLLDVSKRAWPLGNEAR